MYLLMLLLLWWFPLSPGRCHREQTPPWLWLQTSPLILPSSPEAKAQTGFYNFSPLSTPSPSLESHHPSTICRNKAPKWCKSFGDPRDSKADAPTINPRFCSLYPGVSHSRASYEGINLSRNL